MHAIRNFVVCVGSFVRTRVVIYKYNMNRVSRIWYHTVCLCVVHESIKPGYWQNNERRRYGAVNATVSHGATARVREGQKQTPQNDYACAMAMVPSSNR